MAGFIDEFLKMFSYSFMVRALFIGGLVALCSSVLGVVLVLKRYSMIGDGQSHVSFGAMAIALAFNQAPLYIAIPVVMVAAYLLLRISENSKVKGDAAIGLVSSSSVAIGIIINTLEGGSNIDLNSYMFGSILAINKEDAVLYIVVGIIILLAFMFFYHYIFAITFDENFAKATGIKVEIFKTLLAVLTALTIVIGMRIMGTLLISSLIVFPAITSMRVAKKFNVVLILAVIISMVSYFIGMVASFMLEIPSGASIVVVNLVMFIIVSLIRKIREKI